MSTDPLFQMTVTDVFSIRGRGTVVTGLVESGVLRVGDEIRLTGQKGEKKVVVAALEMFRKELKEAAAGTNVGVLLRSLTKDEVHPGDKLSAPVAASSDFTWKP